VLGIVTVCPGVYVGVPHPTLAHAGCEIGGGNAPSVTVQVLPTGMLLRVWALPSVRFTVTLGPEGKQETVIGKLVAGGNGKGKRFFTFFVTVRELTL
jgi:hypothetical protein